MGHFIFYLNQPLMLIFTNTLQTPFGSYHIFYQPPMVDFYQNPLGLLYCIGATCICAIREMLTNPPKRPTHFIFFYQPPVVDFFFFFTKTLWFPWDCVCTNPYGWFLLPGPSGHPIFYYCAGLSQRL